VGPASASASPWPPRGAGEASAHPPSCARARAKGEAPALGPWGCDWVCGCDCDGDWVWPWASERSLAMSCRAFSSLSSAVTFPGGEPPFFLVGMAMEGAKGMADPVAEGKALFWGCQDWEGVADCCG